MHFSRSRYTCQSVSSNQAIVCDISESSARVCSAASCTDQTSVDALGLFKATIPPMKPSQERIISSQISVETNLLAWRFASSPNNGQSAREVSAEIDKVSVQYNDWLSSSGCGIPRETTRKGQWSYSAHPCHLDYSAESARTMVACQSTVFHI